MEFRKGYEEESLLKILNVPPQEIEFMSKNCTKVNRNLILLFEYVTFYSFLSRFMYGIQKQSIQLLENSKTFHEMFIKLPT